jgi:peptidase YpeB-like protein
MIRLRTATALAAGTIAALAIGGTALAAGGDDDPPRVDLLPNGDVITTPTDDPSPSAEPSPSEDPSPSDDSSLGSNPSSSPSATPSRSATSAAGISLDAARTIAIRVAGGGYVESVERETEHGRAVWDVDVIVGGVEHDIDVDRATGEVTRHRTKGSGDDSSGSDDKGGNSGKGSGDSGKKDDKGGHGGHGSDDD